MVEISEENLTLLLRQLMNDNKDLKKEVEELKKEKVTDREVIKQRLTRPLTFSRTRRSAESGPGDKQTDVELSEDLNALLDRAATIVIMDGRRIQKGRY